MSYRMPVAVVLALALNGCSTAPVTVVETEVQVCPPEKPELQCPGMPARGDTLRSLLHAWQAAILAHAQCAETIRVWEQAWESCHAD